MRYLSGWLVNTKMVKQISRYVALGIWGVALSFSIGTVQAKELPAEYIVDAGMSVVDVTPPIGVPLAGFGGRRIIPWDIFSTHKYSFFMKPSKGIVDPIRSKTLVIRKDDRYLAFVSIDVVGINWEMAEDIMNRLTAYGFSKEEIFLHGTHTHSGPGTLFKNVAAQVLTTDFFQPKIYERFVQGVVQSVLQAKADLCPSNLFAYTFKAQGLQKNRRRKIGQFDNNVNVLMVKSITGNNAGKWRGGMVNMAIHGTALGRRNHYYTADVPGAIEYSFAKKLNEANQTKGAVVLFMNGAEGDVAPKTGGWEGMARIGREFGEQAMVTLDTARPILPEWIVRTSVVNLSKPVFHLQNCIKSKFWKKVIGKRFKAGVEELVPREAHLYTLQLGDMIITTWPGEPTAALGLRLKQAGHSVGYSQAWVLGLTNGYLGYFTSPEEFAEGNYEACASFYGPNGGMSVLNGLQTLMSQDKAQKY